MTESSESYETGTGPTKHSHKSRRPTGASLTTGTGAPGTTGTGAPGTTGTGAPGTGAPGTTGTGAPGTTGTGAPGTTGTGAPGTTGTGAPGTTGTGAPGTGAPGTTGTGAPGTTGTGAPGTTGTGAPGTTASKPAGTTGKPGTTESSESYETGTGPTKHSHKSRRPTGASLTTGTGAPGTTGTGAPGTTGTGAPGTGAPGTTGTGAPGTTGTGAPGTTGTGAAGTTGTGAPGTTGTGAPGTTRTGAPGTTAGAGTIGTGAQRTTGKSGTTESSESFETGTGPTKHSHKSRHPTGVTAVVSDKSSTVGIGSGSTSPGTKATEVPRTTAPKSSLRTATGTAGTSLPGISSTKRGGDGSKITSEKTSPATGTILPEEMCTDMQDIIPLGSNAFVTVSINGIPIEPAAIPPFLAVTNLPFIIHAGFKYPATIQEVSVLNPFESDISLIQVSTDQTDDVLSENPMAPRVKFENGIEFVSDLTITLLSTRNNVLPETPVKLSILGCIRNATLRTKAVAESTTSKTHKPFTKPSTAASTKSSSSTTKQKQSTTPSMKCEHDIAIISNQGNGIEKLSFPRYFVKPRTPYNPSDINPGEIGVSFPSSNEPYIIIFPITPAAIIRSIRLPKTTNVDQIRVMFLDADDKPIFDKPSDKVPLQITSNLERNPVVNANFASKVNAVHITLLHTSDNRPPESVTIEIVICLEQKQTTPKTSVPTYKTPATNYTSSTSYMTRATNYTSPIPFETLSTNYIPTIPHSDGACKPKRKAPARITLGECISQQEVEQESCAGYCPSFEELDPLSGLISEKECLCCAPDSTYMESITMDCRNTLTGRIEQRTSQILRVRSCKCSMCLGDAKESYFNNKQTYVASDTNDRGIKKTKTRRR